jgi:hypothetical protein
MMSRQKVIIIGFFVAFTFCFDAFATLSGVTGSGSTPGVWTTDWEAAQKVAKANNIFYCVDFTRSSGCAICKGADDNLYNTARFKKWASDHGIALVEADYNERSSPVTQYALNNWRGGNGGFPMMSFISPDGDAKTRIAGSTVAPGTTADASGKVFSAGDVDPRNYPVECFWYASHSLENWLSFMHFLISRTDDVPSKARSITPDSIDAEILKVNGLYKTYGTNELSYTITKDSSNRNYILTQNANDWYVFHNPEEGKAYQVTGFCEESEPDLGRIFVYASLDAANNGSESLAAAEQHCVSQGYINQLPNGGFQFQVPSAGDVYLQFTRRREKVTATATSEADSMSLSYVFSIKEIRSQSYGFVPNAMATGEMFVNALRGDTYAAVTLNRVDTKGVEKVPYTLHGWFDGDTDATAFIGSDYDYPDGDEHVFTFQDGQETATIRIPVSDTDWDDTCHFYVSVDVGSSLNEEWTDIARVNILDSTSLSGDGKDNPATAVALNDPLFSDEGVYAAGTRLQPGDVADWFKLTNMPAGVICSLEIEGRESPWTGLTGLSMQVYSADGRTALPGKTVQVGNGESTNILFVTSVAGDYLFRVVPVGTSQTTPLMAGYALGLETAERPTVAFANATVKLASPSIDTNVVFDVGVSDGSWLFSPRPTVKTVEETAVDGVDYIGLGEGLEVGEDGKISITLKDAGKWRPERTFKLMLEPDPEGFYRLGSVSNLAITLEADPAEPNGETSYTNPSAIGTSFSYVERNLSNTNTEDALYFTVDSGKQYVLAAKDVAIKPKDTKIDVTIYTNKSTAANVCEWVAYNSTSWSLADLAASENMPLLRFTEDGVIKVEASRQQDEEVLAEYALGLTEWQMPEISFVEAAWTNKQSEAVLEYAIKRTGDTQLPVAVFVTLTCDTARNGVDVTAFKDREIVIPAGQNSVGVQVENLMAQTPDVWKGDRTFALSLEVRDAKLALGAVSNATVTLESEIPEYEEGDSAQESQGNPGVVTNLTVKGDAATFTRRLNGADASDWFKFTDAKVGQSYRFIFEDNELLAWTTNVVPKDVKIEFTLPGIATPVTTNLAAVIHDGCWNSPILAQGGDIVVRVWRPAGTDVSAEYALTAYEWPWPKMTFEQGEDEIDRDGLQTYIFKIQRKDNLMENDLDITNHVTVWLEGDASKYGFSRQTFSFTPGQGETNLAVTLSCKRAIWTGDESFTLKLSVESDDSVEKIKVGDYTNLVVTVKDRTAQYDAADRTDAESGGALKVVNMDTIWNEVGAHLNGCDGRNTDPAIGDDRIDWYVFTGLLKGKTYRFEARDVVAENVDESKVDVKFFFDPAGAPFAVTNLSALAANGYKTPKMGEGQTNVYVQVSRAAAGKSPVYLAYSLAYKMQANRSLYFNDTSVTVSEAASEFAVEVVCETEGEPIDISPVTAVVKAVVDVDGDHPAESPSDFIAGTVQVVTWDIGTVGSVRRVKVPLTNLDSVWEGDETFKLELTCDEDSELGAVRTMLVTIKDIDEPQGGTVSITRVGDPLAKVSATKTYSVREGDTFPIEVRRKGGFAGAVTGVWTWASGTVARRELFADRKDGLAVATDFAIPHVPGAPAGAETTCTFALEGGATLASDSVKTLAFAVTSSDYAGAIAEYSAGDASRPAFSATDAGWYDSVREGTVCAAAASVLKAQIKGPGTIAFTANLPAGVTATARVGNGEWKKVVAGENVLEVGAGINMFGISASGAGVEISDVQFTPSDEFRKVGTYTGHVQVEDSMGKATLTVAQNGRISGKFACADTTWTFTGRGGWTDGRIAVTAKSSGETLAVLFAVDVATGRVTVSSDEGEVRKVVGTLERNCWGDKPMQPGEATALSVGMGYYTATLPCDACGSGYLTLTIAKNGTVKASGVLADGQSVSMAGTLLYGALDGDVPEPYVFLFAAPSSYKGGWFHAFARLAGKVHDGEQNIVLRPFGDISWRSSGAVPFDRAPSLSGGRYDTTANLANYYSSCFLVSNIADVVEGRMTDAGYAASAWGGGALTPIALNFNTPGTRLVSDGEGGDLFSVSFTKATGLFRGNEKVLYTKDGRTVTKSYSYRGALTPIRDEDDNVEGRGFFLIGDQSHEVQLVK